MWQLLVDVHLFCILDIKDRRSNKTRINLGHFLFRLSSVFRLSSSLGDPFRLGRLGRLGRPRLRSGDSPSDRKKMKRKA